jgi:hypothetical protein
MEQYQLYRSHYPQILREIDLELGEPEKLNLGIRLFRGILAVRLGCTTVASWQTMTNAEAAKEVVFFAYAVLNVLFVATATRNSASRAIHKLRDCGRELWW